MEHTGRLGGVQDRRREGSLHGEHGAPMERVSWITASIKGLTVTGRKIQIGDGRRTGDGRREHDRQRASPRLDGLDRGIGEASEAAGGRGRLGSGGRACRYSNSAQVI